MIKIIMAVAATIVLVMAPSWASASEEAEQAAHRARCREEVYHSQAEAPDCVDQHEIEIIEHEREATEEAERNKEAAEARAKALSEPVKYLTVRAVAHQAACRQACEGADRNPGYTAIEATTAPFSYVTIELVRYGRRTERLELGQEESKGTVKIPWTCSSPGGVYRYTVSAHSDVGKALVRRGTFRPVSAARCHWLKHAVQAEREGNEHIARERQRETEREERKRLQQWEGNCRALGDTPVVLHDEGSTIHACRTPEGYTVEVPE